MTVISPREIKVMDSVIDHAISINMEIQRHNDSTLTTGKIILPTQTQSPSKNQPTKQQLLHQKSKYEKRLVAEQFIYSQLTDYVTCYAGDMDMTHDIPNHETAQRIDLFIWTIILINMLHMALDHINAELGLPEISGIERKKLVLWLGHSHDAVTDSFLLHDFQYLPSLNYIKAHHHGPIDEKRILEFMNYVDARRNEHINNYFKLEQENQSCQ